MESVAEVLGRLGMPLKSFDDMSIKEIEERKAAQYNAQRGSLPGADCPSCLNRGYTMRVYQRGDVWYEEYEQCACLESRRNMQRMRDSGITDAEAYTFDAFTTREPWQKRMRDAAMRYARDETPGRWFFVGGAVGCGKTHICAAILMRLMERDKGLYAPWLDESQRLKASATDAEAYERGVTRLKRVPVLYIDDFFKMEPTAPDIRLAHEILNARHTAGLKTILSSERHLDEIVRADEAVGGRIVQHTRGGYALNIAREPGRDWRLNQTAGTI